MKGNRFVLLLILCVLIGISFDVESIISDRSELNQSNFTKSQKQLFLEYELDSIYDEFKIRLELLNFNNDSTNLRKLDQIMGDGFDTLQWSYIQNDIWFCTDEMLENYTSRISKFDANNNVDLDEIELIKLQFKYELLTRLYALVFQDGFSCFGDGTYFISDIKDSVYVGTVLKSYDGFQKSELFINKKLYLKNRNRRYAIPSSDSIELQLDWIVYDHCRRELDTFTHQEFYDGINE